MKIIAYTALRYGRDYYDAAIRSVIDAVDEYHVLYAVTPSHGHWSDVLCPETEDELRAIAEHRAGSKLHWHRGEWAYEGQQRDSIHQYAPDADVILVLDADEVWPEGLIEFYHNLIYFGGETVRQYRVPMIHYWRSMSHCVLHDPAYPVRIINTRIGYGEATLPTTLRINHFGYAQRPEIVEYKWRIHGHLNELRRDVDWFNDVFMANRQFDTHPVGSEYWNPEPVNPLDYLPAWMAEHPYYGREVIE
jgi:hypothetical protein